MKNEPPESEKFHRVGAPPQWDAFISHASSDTPWCEKLATRLRDARVRVWLDRTDVRPGAHLQECITEGFERSRKFIVVMTPSFFSEGRVWTRAEVEGALHEDPLNRKRRVIPLCRKDCEIPLFLRNLVWIDFRTDADFESRCQELIEELDLRNQEIPELTSPFVNRTKQVRVLQKDLRDILKGTSLPRVLSIEGQVGIGKTALARHFALQNESHFQDGHLFLDLKGDARNGEPLSDQDFLRYVIQRYNRVSDPLQSLEFLRRQYLDVLKDRKLLLFADNVASSVDVNQLLPPDGSLLLLTSRERLNMRGTSPLKLDALSLHDAVELLLNHCRRLKGEGERFLSQLAELSGCLPAELEANAKTFHYNDAYTLDDLRRDLERNRGNNYVSATLKAVYQSIPEHLQAAWRKLAVFPSCFCREALKAVWCCDQNALQEQIVPLLRVNLVFLNDETKRFHLLRSAQQLAHALLSESVDDSAITRKAHASHYGEVMRNITDRFQREGEGLKPVLSHFDLEKKSVEAALRWAASIVGFTFPFDTPEALDDPTKIPEISTTYRSTHESTLNVLASYSYATVDILIMRYDLREQICWLAASVAAARVLEDKEKECAALVGLGMIYRYLGNPEASAAFSKSGLVIARDVQDKRAECEALLNIGVALSRPNEFINPGIDDCEKALKIAEDVGDSHSACEALANIGAMLRAAGDLKRAEEAIALSLTIARKNNDRRAEGAACGSLGNVRFNAGEFEGARVRYEEQRDIAIDIGHLRSEGNAIGNLGRVCFRQNDFVKALDLFRECFKIAEAISDQPAQDAAQLNIADTRWEVGERTEAAEGLERWLQARTGRNNRWIIEARERVKLWRKEISAHRKY